MTFSYLYSQCPLQEPKTTCVGQCCQKKLPNQTIVVALGQPDKSDILAHVAENHMYFRSRARDP